MARKVGFGDDQKGELSTADKAVESFRAKTRAERAEKEKRDAERDESKGSLRAALFLAFWLLFWTAAIVVVASTLLFGAEPIGTQLFLMVWLTLAVIGWIAASRTLIRTVQAIRRR